jgi:hypothetical protein
MSGILRFTVKALKRGWILVTLRTIGNAQPASSSNPSGSEARDSISRHKVDQPRRSIMKRILSEVLRRRNGVERRKGRAGALRIEFIERSRDKSLGMEWVFVADGAEWIA